MAFISKNSNDYIGQINSLSKPAYVSKYGGIIEDLLGQIYNKEDFKYDFNADPLYQNYKDNYTKLGKEAAINAAAAVSTQTGGFGNSYAATAATQANQQYLTQLNNVIPELYNAAMNKYKMETDNLYKKFGAFETEEQRQYGMYRDSVGDYYNDWGMLSNGYQSALNQEDWQAEFDYQKERDAIADAHWQAQFDAGNSQWQAAFDNSNYWNQKNFDNDNYWKGLDYALKSAKSGGKGSGSGGVGNLYLTQSNSKSPQVNHQAIIAGARKSDNPAAYVVNALSNIDVVSTGDLNYIMKQLGYTDKELYQMGLLN